jgi:LysM repeat protein
MANRTRIIIVLLILLAQVWPSYYTLVRAQEPDKPHFSSAYDLIDAVNNYRNQHGLPAYTINSILMGTAQSQAEYMATTGTVTHTGPGGISFPDRLIAAGYSFTFRSENIISASPNATGWSLVTSPAWADDLHQHTMLSPDLNEIGAGVAVNGSTGYYVIDCGGSGGGGSAGGYTPVPGSTSIISGGATGTPVVVLPNTPKPDGSISHIVQSGETLWSIAIAYKTTINELKTINHLTSDDIYPGNTLIILLPKATSTAAPTSTGTPYPSSTPFIFWTVTSSPEPTSSPIPSSPVNGGSGVVIAGGIVISALVAAGAMTAAGAKKKRKSEKS